MSTLPNCIDSGQSGLQRGIRVLPVRTPVYTARIVTNIVVWFLTAAAFSAFHMPRLLALVRTGDPANRNYPDPTSTRPYQETVANTL